MMIGTIVVIILIYCTVCYYLKEDRDVFENILFIIYKRQGNDKTFICCTLDYNCRKKEMYFILYFYNQ